MSVTSPAPNSAQPLKYLTPSCQQVAHEDLSGTTAGRWVIRTCLADPAILPAISQHVCHGVALTPAGLYTDMAAVAARHIWRSDRGHDAVTPAIKVCNLSVTKTYIIAIPPKPTGQWLEMEVVPEISPFSSGDLLDATVHCQFRSITPDGVKINDLASCSVVYELDHAWLMSWSHFAPTILARISKLHVRAATETSGDVMHMHRGKAYELFQSFVDYGPKYQNMAEVYVDTQTLEATATHAFQPDPATDYTTPFYMDGSCHISGFVVNAIVDTEKNAYISQGIESMKLSSKFDPEDHHAEIKTYVHMETMPNDKTVMRGDVYVLQNEEIVGVWEGIKFKRIPRKALNVFLPRPKV
ncbi:polyketide synthase dehydratase-domain-containing protein [Neohortaea acidophila]|uniref:Polyketide synthase dehydratase-domain-containing protein n=1 Tax=Neohortaea acidophila TaxID=245834 RepID=A0A6A6PJ63_9PEZI|nr:polyketide synthase dehydratase-domain-containing protein [Neohortaea acidophila]KAF2480069.1 polyketide synthase dehydratase-domain-containing protein [Neohortaea acidophila]